MSILIILTTALLLAFINFNQLISILVYPFSRKAFYRINNGMSYLFWRTSVCMMESWRGVQITYYGDPLPQRQNAIILSNHQSMTDILAMAKLALQAQMAPHLKFLAKDVLKYIPGLGFGMQMVGCLMLKRNWNKDAANIEKSFQNIKSNNIPFWLGSYAEGTRISSRKLKSAQEFARKKGLYVPQHTLIPRTKGFYALVTGLRSQAAAVYDLTIIYPEYMNEYEHRVPSFNQLLEGKVKKIIIHARAFPMETIPSDEADINRWLFDRFQEKDQLMVDYVKHEKLREK